MGGLTGKAALVTGGSRGIGAAIALRLARDGADVAITYRDAADQAAMVVAGIEAAGRHGLALQADSGDAAAVVGAVDRAAAELGRLDVLVNSAGHYPAGPLEAVGLDEIDRALAVHVRAPFLAAQAAVRHMREGGRIVTIWSNLAERVPYEGVTLYATSKSALVGLTKGLARDLGPRGISVTLVHPGSTNTDMNPADGPDADGERALAALQRYAEPDEIAATVAHLAGPHGAYATGSAFTVDGGFTA